MRERYLEVTFRKGRPLAAYLYLPRATDTKSARTERAAEGILVDYAATGEPIGIEIMVQRISLALTLALHDLPGGTGARRSAPRAGLPVRLVEETVGEIDLAAVLRRD